MGNSFSNMFPKYAAAYVITMLIKGMHNSLECMQGKPRSEDSIIDFLIFMVLLVKFDGGIHGPIKDAEQAKEAEAQEVETEDAKTEEVEKEAPAGDTGSTPEPVNTVEARDEKPAEPVQPAKPAEPVNTVEANPAEPVQPAEPAQKPKRRIEPTLISKKSSGFWCF